MCRRYGVNASHPYSSVGNKTAQYTLILGDLNARVGGQTNTSERATGCFGLGQRNERGDTLAECATSKNFKIMNTISEESREEMDMEKP